MSVKYLALVIGIVLTSFTLRATLAQEEENVEENIKEAIMMFVAGSSRERVEAAKKISEIDPEDIIAYDAWEPFTKILKEDDSPHVQLAVVTAFGVMGNNAYGLSKQRIADLMVKTFKNEDLRSLVRAEALNIAARLLLDDPGQRNLFGTYLVKQLDTKNTIILKSVIRTLTMWNWDLNSRVWDHVINENLILRSTAIRNIKNQMVFADLKINTIKAKSLLSIIDNEQNNNELRIDLINLLAFALRNGSQIPLADTLDRIIKRKKDSQVTLAAVYAIGATSNPNLIKLLIKVFNEHKGHKEMISVMIRSSVCTAARDFIVLPIKQEGYFVRHKTDFEKLSDMLVGALMDDSSNLVRKEAAYSLGNLTSRKFDRSKPVAALIESITEQDETMTKTVLNSLMLITDQDFSNDKEAWQSWYKTNQRDLMAK